MKQSSSMALWSIMDSLKGVMSSEQALDLVSTVYFIRQQSPYDFDKLLNTGKSSLVDSFLEVRSQIRHDYPHCFEDLSIPVDADSVSRIFIKIDEASTLQGFSRAFRDLVQNTLSARSGDHVSSPNDIPLHQALLGSVDGQCIYDGAAGLASTVSALNANHLYLQDIKQNTATMAARLLQIEGRVFTYSVGNSLENSEIARRGHDYAVMTPPFGLRLPSTEKINNQPYLFREIQKKVPTSGADSLWLQLAFYSLNENGKAYITLAPGWLFRGGYDLEVRKHLIEHELIESIIMLPSGYFDYTQIQGALVVLQKNKPQGTPVRLIDARDLGRRNSRGNILKTQDIELIANLYHGDVQNEVYCKDVPLSEIRSKEYNLGFGNYFYKEVEKTELNPDVEIQRMIELNRKHTDSQRKLSELLAKHMPK